MTSGTPGSRAPASGRRTAAFAAAAPRTCGGASRAANFSAYSPWRSHLPPARSSARWADLQKLRNPAKAPGCPDLFLLSEGNEADISSELRFYMVAGVGFEPT
jgi:hypothetical protein